MAKKLTWCISAVILAFTAWTCTKAPISGRSQLNLIPASELRSMSYQQYDQVLAESKLSGDSAKVQTIRRVGGRIQHAVEDYLASVGKSDLVKGYDWEFNLIESEEANAWCMPGGKVAFYTGILPICEDDTGIAVVMGHEVAHAVAEHGAERMSHGMVQQMGGMALSTALAKEPAATQSLFMTAFGAGTELGVLLPFSRTQESEADYLGLVFMARAGYHPEAAVEFWQRMAAKGGSGQPEFMSTHPSDATRIENIKKHLPEAQQQFRAQ